jgi:DNA-binding MarR family transcriptional regulator
MASLEEVLKMKPVANAHLRAFLNIMVTGAWLQGKMNNLLKPFGITEPQYNVLRILRGQNGRAMNLYEISERMVYPTSNVSRIIDRLLLKNYVIREANATNRRRVDISITAEGLQLLAGLDPVVSELIGSFENTLDDENAKQLSSWLEQVRE